MNTNSPSTLEPDKALLREAFFHYKELKDYYYAAEICLDLLQRNEFNQTAWHLLLKCVTKLPKEPDNLKRFSSLVQIPFLELKDCAASPLHENFYRYIKDYEKDPQKALDLATLILERTHSEGITPSQQSFWNFQIGSCLVDLEKKQESIEYLEESLKLQPSIQTALLLAKIYSDLNKDNQLDSLLMLFPQCIELHLLKAKVLSKQSHRHQDVVNYIEKIIKLDPLRLETRWTAYQAKKNVGKEVKLVYLCHLIQSANLNEADEGLKEAIFNELENVAMESGQMDIAYHAFMRHF